MQLPMGLRGNERRDVRSPISADRR
jgi:hypothetical protein